CPWRETPVATVGDAVPCAAPGVSRHRLRVSRARRVARPSKTPGVPPAVNPGRSPALPSARRIARLIPFAVLSPLAATVGSGGAVLPFREGNRSHGCTEAAGFAGTTGQPAEPPPPQTQAEHLLQ